MGGLFSKREGTLGEACQKRDYKLVEQLLKKGAKIDVDILVAACLQRDDVRVARLLIEHGVESIINTRNKAGWTPLAAACYWGTVDTVKVLVESNADVNKSDTHGDKPLALASKYKDHEKVEILLNKGARIDSDILVEACRQSHNHQVVALLLQYGGYRLIYESDKHGRTPLRAAHEEGTKDVYQLLCLLDDYLTGTNDTLADYLTGTDDIRLAFACRMKDEEKTKTFLNDGASVDSGILVDACRRRDNVRVLKLLLQHGGQTPISERGRGGWTPLAASCQKGTADMVQLLVNHNADVNKPNEDGTIPLTFACRNKDEEKVEILLNKGARIDFDIVLEACRQRDNVRVLGLILQHGGQRFINMSDRLGWTPLAVACAGGSADMVQLLLENNAKCDSDAVAMAFVYIFDVGRKDLDSIENLVTLLEFFSPQSHNDDEEHRRARNQLYGALLSVFSEYRRTLLDYNIYKRLCNLIIEYVNEDTRDLHARTLLEIITDQRYEVPASFAESHHDLLLHVCQKFHHQFEKEDKYSRTLLFNLNIRHLGTLYKYTELTEDTLRRIVNRQDKNGQTALHVALQEIDEIAHCHEKVKILLDLDANPSIRDNHGITAYHLATRNTAVFKMVLERFPREFHGEELALLQRMALNNGTLSKICDVLNIPPSDEMMDYMMPDPLKQFCQLHKKLGNKPKRMLKNWSEKYTGSKTVIEFIMKQNALCTQGEKIREMQDMTIMIKSLINLAARKVGELEPLFHFTPVIAGSSFEGTKVTSPNEIDMVCEFRSKCIEDGVSCIIKVANDDGTEEILVIPFPRYVTYRFFTYFMAALQTEDLWNEYPALSWINQYSIKQTRKTINELHLMWQGTYYPAHLVKVDIVPAFRFVELPWEIPDHPLHENLCPLMVPKGDEFKPSVERSEAALFHIMPDELKQAYMFVKTVAGKLEGTLTSRFTDISLPSYPLKTATFSVFERHPEYEQRLSQLIDSYANPSEQSITQHTTTS